MPSISSRPSASTMRQPCVAGDRKRRARGLHLRVGQPDVIEPGVVPVGWRAPRVFAGLPTFGCFHARNGCIVPLTDCRGHACSACRDRREAMRSLDEFASGKLAALERAHLRRTLVDDDARRHLGGAQRPPAALVLLQRLSQPYPAPGRHQGGDRGGATLRRRRRRLAPGHRQPSALRGAGRPAGAAQGRREAACVFGSGYLANTGIIPALVGPDDLILLDELSHACIHAGAKLSGAASCRYRHNDVAHAEALLARAPRQPSARADRDRRRLFHGRRSRAARTTWRRWRSASTPGSSSDDAHGLGVVGGGRGSSFANGERRRRAAADGHAVEGDRRLRRLSLRLASGHRPHAHPRAHLHLFDRPAAAGGRRRHRRPRPDRARAGLRRRAAAQGEGSSPARSNLPEAQSAIVPVVLGESRCGAGGVATAGGRRLSGRRDPAADRAAKAPRGCASPSPRSIPTPRSSGSPTSCDSRVI